MEEERASLEEIVVSICPCLSMAINYYYKLGDIEKLSRPNHFSINRYTAMDFSLNLDTSVLEIILDKMYDSNFSDYITRSGYNYFDDLLYEKDVLFIDSKITHELNQLLKYFHVNYRKEYVYSIGYVTYAAVQFQLDENDLKCLIEKMDMNLFDLTCRRVIMERKFS